MVLCRQFFGGVVAVTLFSMTGVAQATLHEQPVLNPAPKHFLTLKGRIDPQLKGKIHLQFVQSYVAMNKDCMQYINRFEGVLGHPVKDIVFTPKLDERGNYSLLIPLDKYVYGRCHWQSSSLGLHLTDSTSHQDFGPEGFIVYGKTSKHIPSYYNYVCQDTVASCRLHIPPGSLAGFSLSAKRSSTQVFNLLSKTSL